MIGRGCAEITQAFELLAEQDVDLLEPFYRRFFQLCPEALILMGHSDEPMRGRMLEQTIELLMDSELQGPGNYFRWEIANHLSAYGVSAEMYAAYFQALGDELSEALGEAWHASFAAGWRMRIADLLQDVEDSRAAPQA
jgi:hemoglobin-like flavoprotein